MYILYLDESGVPQPHPSQTSHYIFLGTAVYIGSWFWLERKVQDLKSRYALGAPENFELHAAWIRRPYPEQLHVPDFNVLGSQARYDAVEAIRRERRQTVWPTLSGSKRQDESRVHRLTEPYIHLTLDEREKLIDEALHIVADSERRVVLFAEAIDKARLREGLDPVDQAFTQVVTRFNHFLNRRKTPTWGLLAIDRDEHKANRLIQMLRRFQRDGSRWGMVDRVVEAPFFFESTTSSCVQVTDLCAYAVRRYFENHEEDRFDTIYHKFDRTASRLHGIRHYTAPGCPCRVCRERGHE